MKSLCLPLTGTTIKGKIFFKLLETVFEKKRKGVVQPMYVKSLLTLSLNRRDRSVATFSFHYFFDRLSPKRKKKKEEKRVNRRWRRRRNVFARFSQYKLNFTFASFGKISREKGGWRFPESTPYRQVQRTVRGDFVAMDTRDI